MNKDKTTIDDEILPMTTIVGGKLCIDNITHAYNASGFFYTEQEAVDESFSHPQWVKIKKYWLVTNRHVLFPVVNANQYLLDELDFGIRITSRNKVEWEFVELDRDDLIKRVKLHSDDRVDVAIVDVTEYINSITKKYSQSDDIKVKVPYTLSNYNLPSNQPYSLEVCSDIIVASYPKGFYDYINKFPIIKSGIIASSWGTNFNGLPMFEIDAQLFPGSSGGMVLSKPINIAVIDDTIKYSKEKQYALLGIYSGEYKYADPKDNENKSFGLGNVWYSYLIPEIIDSGVTLIKGK